MDFCLDALERALRRGRPEIFNSDQGSQFTSEKFTGVLAQRGVAISMDGRGRCLDNIFIERLWRSLKYEEVYLRDYTRVPEARSGIGNRVWTTAPRPPFSRPATYEEQDSLDLGAPPPDPRDFSLYRQNGWRYNQCT